VKDAVDAIKRGASDFIAKPFQFDELMHVLKKALEQRRLAAENAYLRSQLEERYQFGGILGRWVGFKKEECGLHLERKDRPRVF
jgi:DNA-binding NtrC family response regulator